MMQKKDLITNLSLCLFLSGITLPAFAKIYKWVDAAGQTHYTQSLPPDGLESEPLRHTSTVDTKTAQEILLQQQQKADYSLEERKKKAKAAAKKKSDAEIDRKNCDTAKANLARLKQPRINLVDEKGETYRATEKEHQSSLKKAREDVVKYCNKK